jgi:hypothetical protein
MFRPLIDFLQERGFGGSTVDPRNDGSMFTVIPSEGRVEETIQDQIDDMVIVNCP